MSWQTPARWAQACGGERVDGGGAGDVLDLAVDQARRSRARPRRGGARSRRSRERGSREVLGRATRTGSARYSVNRSATSRLRMSSQRIAGRRPGPVGVHRRRRRDRQRRVRVEHLERGHLGAAVVAVGVGPRRRGHLEPGVDDDLARQGQRGQPGLVERGVRLAVVLEARRVDDPQLHAHCPHPVPGRRLGAGEVAPA